MTQQGGIVQEKNSEVKWLQILLSNTHTLRFADSGASPDAAGVTFLSQIAMDASAIVRQSGKTLDSPDSTGLA